MTVTVLFLLVALILFIIAAVGVSPRSTCSLLGLRSRPLRSWFR